MGTFVVFLLAVCLIKAQDANLEMDSEDFKVTGYFALVHGEHELFLDSRHLQLLNTGELEINVIHIGPRPLYKKNKHGSHHITSESDFVEFKHKFSGLNAHGTSIYKIYEFPKGSKDHIFHTLHGDSGSLSSHVLMFEKNGIIHGNRKIRAKQHNKTPANWINTRWGQRRDQLIAEGSLCRFAQGSGHIGYQTGSFSWGIDVLDTRDGVQDLIYCPVNDLTGVGSHVYILDTGIGTQSTMNTSNIHCDYDYYYDVNVYGSRPPCDDGEGHGSHVAGLVASNIYGVAPGATLHIYKVLSDQGFGSFSGLAAALTDIYAKNVNRGIITMSLGVYGDTSSTVHALITNLMEDRDMVITAAAGNDGKDACSNFPSNIQGVVSIGAVDVNIRKPDFSNYGSCVSIFAPGRDILSCGKLGTQAIIMSGTSMATPIMAGAFAIYRQAFPTATHTTLITKMLTFATPNMVGNRGPNSPNLLVYLGGFSSSGTAPPPGNVANSALSSAGLNLHDIFLYLVVLFGISMIFLE